MSLLLDAFAVLDWFSISVFAGHSNISSALTPLALFEFEILVNSIHNLLFLGQFVLFSLCSRWFLGWVLSPVRFSFKLTKLFRFKLICIYLGVEILHFIFFLKLGLLESISFSFRISGLLYCDLYTLALRSGRLDFPSLSITLPSAPISMILLAVLSILF